MHSAKRDAATARFGLTRIDSDALVQMWRELCKSEPELVCLLERGCIARRSWRGLILTALSSYFEHMAQLPEQFFL